MSSDRINDKSLESVKSSLKIKELRSLDEKEIQLKSRFKEIYQNQFNIEFLNDIDDNFGIVHCLHLLLANCSNLTHNQKFDFCISQRYFMKLYLKEILRKT